jgi:hypothetical protein
MLSELFSDEKAQRFEHEGNLLMISLFWLSANSVNEVMVD